jgi:hypothetical protein
MRIKKIVRGTRISEFGNLGTFIYKVSCKCGSYVLTYSLHRAESFLKSLLCIVPHYALYPQCALTDFTVVSYYLCIAHIYEWRSVCTSFISKHYVYIVVPYTFYHVLCSLVCFVMCTA